MVERSLSWLRSASPLSYCPALSFNENQSAQRYTSKFSQWACVGVKGKGSERLFTHSLERMSEGQSSSKPCLPCRYRPALQRSISYQLPLALRTGFHGALRLTRAAAQHKHSGLVLASSLRMGWWNTALAAACDKGCTLAQA